MKKYALVLYAPVIHAGYLEFFKRHRNAKTLYILGRGIIDQFTELHKEIRALDPEITKKFVETLGIFEHIKVLKPNTITDLKDYKIITADEPISRRFAKKYLQKNKIVFDSIFLKWDEKNVYSRNLPKNAETSKTAFDRKMMKLALKESTGSGDWWRQVGAIIVKNKKVILRDSSHHLPSDHTPYIEGNPRDFIEAGKKRDLSTSIHVEQLLIAEAAKRGLNLNGSSIYVNVFPCVPCAQIISQSGIKKCFFQTGNAYLNVERVFRAAGVKLIRVK
ncbi:MAG: hypothetical protein UY23_C0001G0221 [Candidatus Jorgensenbacteria bacterium GW2011_GWA1_48_11]|uniref:CMP/dCMP-type deaminase domain-containing protein n=1 Tax=Candidatus Jorgensenbacteria bacterium GW2011_GWA1_48_11 TaxID=1618660 RepID=A0A0G1XBE5_9BACT|nr:MAG: hypothetical protein UY23_C0001G0221 [Candidatus Jorgensenbacteria bacterium GW2011_GWA1_48_11]KKW12107.1 MAG: hypothetical protein UY51_C0005G0349 [Candidatus Jorgensenbacteria bacterium GW2011_GWB1_49_9]